MGKGHFFRFLFGTGMCSVSLSACSTPYGMTAAAAAAAAEAKRTSKAVVGWAAGLPHVHLGTSMPAPTFHLHCFVPTADYLNKVVVKGKQSSNTKVSDIMTPSEVLLTVTPQHRCARVA